MKSETKSTFKQRIGCKSVVSKSAVSKTIGALTGALLLYASALTAQKPASTPVVGNPSPPSIVSISICSPTGTGGR